jgi:hypothetical protein
MILQEQPVYITPLTAVWPGMPRRNDISGTGLGA